MAPEQTINAEAKSWLKGIMAYADLLNSMRNQLANS